MMTRVKQVAVLVCGAVFFSSLTLVAAQPYIYPNAGDAGEGVAIGAGVGALFGGLRRARQRQEEQQAQQSYATQQQGAMSQGRSNYERAFGACMAGRGYTVR